MKHKGTITLETERLILRRFTPADGAAMFRNLYGDADAMRFLPWSVHADVSESQSLLMQYINGYIKPDCYAWAIVPKTVDQPIGFIDAVADEGINGVKVDYGIGKLWWRKGIATEALAAVIRFFFDETGTNRMFATHDPRNPNSGKVMQKNGMKYEGTLRQARYRKGEYSDRAMYAILAEEYFAEPVGVSFDVRSIDEKTRPLVTAFLTDYWFGPFIIIRGEVVELATVDGFALIEKGRLTGAITYIVRGEACEIVSLNSVTEKRGVGTALVNVMIARARALGCTRVQLLTTNDNLNAIGFYQKRGFALLGVNLGAIDRGCRQNPAIPLIGQNGIPLRHEIEFLMNLREETI